MSNGMPSWEEWSGLTQDARDYKQFETLVVLTRHLQSQCPARLEACDARFKTLEKRKWFDRAASVAGGAISGALGALGIKIGT